MEKLNRTDQIWSATPTDEHRRSAAEYASRTLPWTFNRMSKPPTAKKQVERALNIVKGLTAQGVLHDALDSAGVASDVQIKSHREKDLYDFFIVLDGVARRIDAKANSYYNDYPGDSRPPFSLEYLIENRGYFGADWRKFFPMLMAHTQIAQEKYAYFFAITESVDVRQTVVEKRRLHKICAFPHGNTDLMDFYASPALCLARERAQKGFFISLELFADTLFTDTSVKLKVLYEWNSMLLTEEVTVAMGRKSDPIGPISIFNCVEVCPEEYEAFEGTVVVNIEENQLSGAVLNTTKRNVNVPPSHPLTLGKSAFGNLILPDDFMVHLLGWIRKDEFLEACLKYSAWFCPKDSEGREFNTVWSQVTERDQQLLKKLGWEGRIRSTPKTIAAGLMKTSGRGQGACCYVFPNGFSSGVQETNLYVLPQDLWSMQSLVDAAGKKTESTSHQILAAAKMKAIGV
jgi:hypothetical protein